MFGEKILNEGVFTKGVVDPDMILKYKSITQEARDLLLSGDVLACSYKDLENTLAAAHRETTSLEAKNKLSELKQVPLYISEKIKGYEKVTNYIMVNKKDFRKVMDFALASNNMKEKKARYIRENYQFNFLTLEQIN